MKKIILNVLIIICTLILVSCDKSNDNGSDINLAKNVDGKDLTEEFCINLVRNYWDCKNGARLTHSGCGSPSTIIYTIGCEDGQLARIMSDIAAAFEIGLVETESYYRSRILHLEAYASCNSRIITIVF